jgi:integral membrane protein (TIGR01906 family)
VRIIKWILITWIGIIFALNGLLLPFQAMAFDSDYYVDSFLALEVDKTIGISQESLSRVTESLVTHIDKGTGDLKNVENVRGVDVVFYNEKEQHHLHDIMILVKAARTFLILVNISMVVALITVWFIDKRNKQLFLKSLTQSFQAAVIASLIALGTLVALYFIDFDWAFRKFHEIFFTNDLWLLDPKTDRLIQMMPLEFFIDFTKQWLSKVFLVFILFITAGFIVPKLKKSKSL